MKLTAEETERFRKRIEHEILSQIEKELQPYETRFWGEKIHVTPAFVQDYRGDGLQLIWLSSIDTRPQYYILRVDSHIDVNSDDFDLEYILRLISKTYGDSDQYVCIDSENDVYVLEGEEDDPDARKFTFDDLDFPMLSWEGGSWGLIKNFRTGKTGEYCK
ncbi:MAG: hypothetical protein NC410_09165 [Oscillibacter sp.]|nr:hypothetical protein [Oscillibacter sp.]